METLLPLFQDYINFKYMPLLIKVEDHKGEVIGECIDQHGLLNSLLEYCYKNPAKLSTFKYIDLYDDTVFNSLQIKDLISDIDFLKQQSQIMNQEKFEFLSLLTELCNKSLKEPHQYLKFYGD